MKKVVTNNATYFWNETEIVIFHQGSKAPDERIISTSCFCGQPAAYTIQAGWYNTGGFSFPLYEPLCEKCYDSYLDEYHSAYQEA